MDANEETTRLLREIRDGQREAMALQREHIAMHQRLLERIERINDRAGALQGGAGRALGGILWIALPMIVLLLALVAWPYARYMFG